MQVPDLTSLYCWRCAQPGQQRTVQKSPTAPPCQKIALPVSWSHASQGHWYLRLPLLLLLNNEESEPLCRSSPSPDPGARREEPVGRWRREPGASPEHLGYLMTKTRCITWSPWIMITRTMVGCKWSKDDNGDNNDKEKIRYPKPLQKKIDEAHVPQFRAPYPLPCRRRRTDYNTLHSSLLSNGNNGENDQTYIWTCTKGQQETQ